MVAWALSCSVNWALVLWIRKEKIKTHSTKSSTQGLFSNLHVLFEVKTVGDSGFMNDRIALVSHLSAHVWTRLSLVFTRLYSSLICLWLVFIRLHWSLIRLHSSALVSHLTALVLPLICNISNNRPEACNSIKKEALAQVLSCEFCEVSKNTLFTEHLWGSASIYHQYLIFTESLCFIINVIDFVSVKFFVSFRNVIT